MASSFYLCGGFINVGLFPELYYLKHASISFLGVVGFLSFFVRQKKTVSILFALIIPYFAYLGIMYGIVFLQLSIFLVSVTVLSRIYSKNFLSKKILFLYLLVIMSVPAFDVILNSGNFLFNTYYGRERLLLGYFHPKEAGMMMLVFFISVLLSGRIHNRLLRTAFSLIAIIILYLIQSRNALLFYVNFIVINLLIKKFGIKQVLLIIVVVYLIVPIYTLVYYFEEVNLLTSYRISNWVAGLKFNIFGQLRVNSIAILGELFKYKFHIDNFYLEFLIEAGVLAFVIMLLLLCYLGYKIRNFRINGNYVLSIYMAFLIYCLFDAGMFSTGNFINVFVWSIVAFALKNKVLLHENFIRCHHIP
jgi:hypothetical protein